MSPEWGGAYRHRQNHSNDCATFGGNMAMNSRQLHHFRPSKRAALALCALGFLTACGDPNAFFAPDDQTAKTDAETAATPVVLRGELQDVEAPEIFQVTDQGLWDGRPSLGGIWVAHPDVGDPQRVLVRNESNGQTVIGALFRRERDNPGPVFQVSSDAADALGMLAGAPAELNVTALIREEVTPPEPEPAPQTDPVAETDTLPQPETIETESLETSSQLSDDIADTPVTTAAASPPSATSDLPLTEPLSSLW